MTAITRCAESMIVYRQSGPATNFSCCISHPRASSDLEMPRFLIGDERGQIKSLYYSAEPFEDGSRCKLTTLSHRVNGEQKTSIQRMAAGVDVGGSRTVRILVSITLLLT